MEIPGNAPGSVLWVLKKLSSNKKWRILIPEDEEISIEPLPPSDLQRQEIPDTEIDPCGIDQSIKSDFKGLKDLDQLLKVVESSTFNSENVLNRPIANDLVKAGKVYIFSVNAMKNQLDKYWRLDGLMWHHNGSYGYPTASSTKRWNVIRHTLRLGNKQFDQKQIEARLIGCEFDDLLSWRVPYVFVAYFGTYDLGQYPKKLFHGNAKDPFDKVQRVRLRKLMNNDDCDSEEEFQNRSPKKRYIRSRQTLIASIRDKVTENKKPQQILCEITNEVVNSGGHLEDMPKDLNQISKVKQRMKVKEEVEDDILEVLYYAMSTKFVPFQATRDGKFAVVCVVPDVIQHLKQILRNGDWISLHYDSTYNIGLYYTSILTFKHPYLKRGPIIPLAFYFHQQKDETTHYDFFATMVGLLPLLNSDLVCLITDREAAIKAAVKGNLPNAIYFHCDEHIKTNVLHAKTYMDLPLNARADKMTQINQLIHSATEKSFDDRLGECQVIWNQDYTAFWKYFEKNILGDLRTSSRFNAEQYGVFYPVGGVSNNVSEAINSLFKSLLGKQTNMAKSAAMKKAVMLMNAKLNRIKVAVVDDFGDFQVEQRYSEKAKGLEFPINLNAIPENQIQSIFDEGVFNNTVDHAMAVETGASYVKSIEGIASWIAKNPSQLQFTQGEDIAVKGVEGPAFYVNTITGRCTCHHAGVCEHQLAVRLKGIPCNNGSRMIRKSALKLRRNLTKLNQAAVSRRVGKKIGARLNNRSKLFPTLAPKRRTMLPKVCNKHVNVSKTTGIASHSALNEIDNEESHSLDEVHVDDSVQHNLPDQLLPEALNEVGYSGTCSGMKSASTIPGPSRETGALNSESAVPLVDVDNDGDAAEIIPQDEAIEIVATKAAHNPPPKKRRRKSPVIPKTITPSSDTISKSSTVAFTSMSKRGRPKKNENFCFSYCPNRGYGGGFMVSFHICQNWFHGKCLKLTKSQIKTLKIEEDEPWFCPGCEEN